MVAYPDPAFYLNEVQSYFFRNEGLRHLRPGQYFRYFMHHADEATRAPVQQRTYDETATEQDKDRVPDEPSHRHYDSSVSEVAAGTRERSMIAKYYSS